MLTGIPASAVPKRILALAVSAENPPIGLNSVSFMPIVRITFHPPVYVPAAIDRYAAIITHVGT